MTHDIRIRYRRFFAHANEILREILSVGILGKGFFTERTYADGVFPGTYP